MDGKTIGASDGARGMTQSQLLNLIGAPSNDRLREIWRLLVHYKYNESELEILHKEVLGSMSKRALRKEAGEAVQSELIK